MNDRRNGDVGYPSDELRPSEGEVPASDVSAESSTDSAFEGELDDLYASYRAYGESETAGEAESEIPSREAPEREHPEAEDIGAALNAFYTHYTSEGMADAYERKEAGPEDIDTAVAFGAEARGGNELERFVTAYYDRYIAAAKEGEATASAADDLFADGDLDPAERMAATDAPRGREAGEGTEGQNLDAMLNDVYRQYIEEGRADRYHRRSDEDEEDDLL